MVNFVKLVNGEVFCVGESVVVHNKTGVVTNIRVKYDKKSVTVEHSLGAISIPKSSVLYVSADNQEEDQ